MTVSTFSNSRVRERLKEQRQKWAEPAIHETLPFFSSSQSMARGRCSGWRSMNSHLDILPGVSMARTSSSATPSVLRDGEREAPEPPPPADAAHQREKCQSPNA